MSEASSLAEIEQPQGRSSEEVKLLVSSEHGFRSFLQNFHVLFVQRGRLAHGDPGDLWKDVFVERRLPWARFLQSLLLHGTAIALIWTGSRFLALQPQVAAESRLRHEDVVYYTPAEYLPAIDTRRPSRGREQTADPEVSQQPIISLPHQAENRSQTVITPPAIKLRHDVNLPSIVSWGDKPRIPIAPAPMVLASETQRLAPQIEQSIVAPPPDLLHAEQAQPHDFLKNPQAGVIAPPQQIESAPQRVGDISVAQSAVIAPAPQISLEAQRPARSTPSLVAGARVVAPPPSLGGAQVSRMGNMIALSLHPAVEASPKAVEGSRRGSFASSAEGRHGAAGSPGSSGAPSGEGTVSAKKNGGELPAGLYVGKVANAGSSIEHDGAPSISSAYSVNPKLLASARLPRISRTLQPENESKLAEEERAVFGDRKFYSLSLNMPNLNSAGGSWIIRFAALKDLNSSDSASASAVVGRGQGVSTSVDLSAPSVSRKVDPAYPLELMRQNVSGTVILYAVIHSDGTVGSIRVLRSADQRLDQFASEAISRWKFDPATRNGAPVDVEATFWIPFRPAKTASF